MIIPGILPLSVVIFIENDLFVCPSVHAIVNGPNTCSESLKFVYDHIACSSRQRIQNRTGKRELRKTINKSCINRRILVSYNAASAAKFELM